MGAGRGHQLQGGNAQEEEEEEEENEVVEVNGPAHEAPREGGRPGPAVRWEEEERGPPGLSQAQMLEGTKPLGQHLLQRTHTSRWEEEG